MVIANQYWSLYDLNVLMYVDTNMWGNTSVCYMMKHKLLQNIVFLNLFVTNYRHLLFKFITIAISYLLQEWFVKSMIHSNLFLCRKNIFECSIILYFPCIF